jgi:hypothetical protein
MAMYRMRRWSINIRFIHFSMTWIDQGLYILRRRCIEGWDDSLLCVPGPFMSIHILGRIAFSTGGDGVSKKNGRRQLTQ